MCRTCATGLTSTCAPLTHAARFTTCAPCPGPTHTNVIFDCVRPADCALSPDELHERTAEIVKEKVPNAVCKITIDESYVSSRQ